MAKDLGEVLVNPEAKLEGAEKPRMDLGAHLEYIESLLERGGGGSVDLVKPVFTEQKAPVPNTGYLEKFFFNRELKPEQVDSLIANANLTFTDIDGIPGYLILWAGSEQASNPKILIIMDGSALLGLASGPAWVIMLMGGSGDTVYYASPAVAEALGDMEAG